MRDIIIFGAGGFGREVALMIRQINERQPTWNILGFCDENSRKGTLVDGLPVIGGLQDLNNNNGSVAVVIAIADPAVRRSIRIKIQNPKIDFPVLIHPSVLRGDTSFGEGTIICAGNILTTGITLKSFVVVNLSCTIGHDVVVNDFCSIMPGCSVSGSVVVESDVLIGTGAKILQGIRIFERSRVGAGAVVTRDVMANTTVVGVPARPMIKK